tara:strand:+ start:415 stop:2166 length:1752 start_codon:yes stop_codon:yes gene_type:complete
MLGFLPLASGPLGVSRSGDITLSATESFSTQVLITVSLGTINTNIGYPIDIALQSNFEVTSHTSNVTVTSDALISTADDIRIANSYSFSRSYNEDGSYVDTWTPLSASDRRYFVQLGAGSNNTAYDPSVFGVVASTNSDAYLATQDNSVTLTGFSMSAELVAPVSAIVGVFRTIDSYSIQSVIGELDLTGYNFLLDFPALPLLTSSLGEPRFAVVYNSALQSDAPYNHDQEVIAFLGSVTPAVFLQAQTTGSFELTLLPTITHASATGTANSRLQSLTELLVSLGELENRVATEVISGFIFGTTGLGELENDSSQVDLDTSLLIGTVVYNTTFEHPFQAHPNLVAEDSLLATVSLEQLANHSDQIELSGVFGTISLDPLANEVAVKELSGLPIPLTLSDITTQSQNNIDVTNPDFATVSLGVIRLNVTQEIVGSDIGSVSLGDISTQTVSNIILTTSEVALESNLDITHTLSARVTHNSNVIPISIGDISLVTHANTTIGGFEVVSAHGILSPFALSGLFLTLHDNVQGVTATGVHFDYEAIKHLYNPARSSFPLPVSRQVRPTLAVSNKATVTPTSPRKIAA